MAGSGGGGGGISSGRSAVAAAARVTAAGQAPRAACDARARVQLAAGLVLV